LSVYRLATKAIRETSGDQSGSAADGSEGKSRARTARVFTFTMRTLLRPVGSERANAISSPVGDQEASESDSPEAGHVTCSIPDPSALATKIARELPGAVSAVKAILAPSNAQAGSDAS